jgi:oligopeptide transport system substrate-binding protein
MLPEPAERRRYTLTGEPREQKRRGGTLYRDLYRSAASMTLDPALALEASHVEVTLQLFDGLVQPDRQAQPSPAIARRWEVSPDGLTWTFYLRQDVRFHASTEKGQPTQNGGRTVTAHDFVYAWERASDPATGSPGVAYFGYLAGWEALDDFAFQVRLEERFAPFLHLLLSPCFLVAPREDVAYWGPAFHWHPVGSGAYRFVEQQGDRFMLLEANPDYLEGRPPIEHVHYSFTADDAERMAKLKRGILDYEEIPDPWWDEVQAEPLWRDKIVTQPILGLTYLGFNCQASPLDGERGRLLRQAICHAFDKERFVREVRRGKEQAAGGILPPGMQGFASPREFYPYDPSKSRALLAQAGYPDGRGLSPLTIGQHHSEEHERMAVALQDDLGRVGIRCQVWATDWERYIERLGAGEVQLYLMGWIGDYADPSSFLTVLFHSRKGVPPHMGGTFYRDSRADALLDEADATLEVERRTALYRKAETIIMEDPPLLPLFYLSRSVVVWPWVGDFYLSPKAGLADILYKRLWLGERPKIET